MMSPWNLFLILSFWQAIFLAQSNNLESFTNVTTTNETEVAMLLEEQQSMTSFCNSHKRFSVKTSTKTHHIRLEAVIASGVHGVVCTARSTKSMIPKGRVYAVKLSPEHMNTEALFLSRMQNIPSVVQCLWECLTVKIRHVTQRKVAGITMPSIRTYNALAMEYFPAPSIREWLRAKSLPLQPPTPYDARLEIFRDDGVRLAYQSAKNAAISFWEDKWIHRDMHVGNFLWKEDTQEIRIVDVAMATKKGYHHVNQLEWMHNIGRDFRFFAYTFGLAILCPEEWLDRPLDAEETLPNPKAVDCINFNEILPIMRQFDPEFNMVMNFMQTNHRDLRLLPPRFQHLSRRFSKNPHELSGEEFIQSIADRMRHDATPQSSQSASPSELLSSSHVDTNLNLVFTSIMAAAILITAFILMIKSYQHSEWKLHLLHDQEI